MYKAIVITAINKMSRASEFSEPLLAATLPMLSRQSRKSLLVTSAMTELRHYAAMKKGTGDRRTPEEHDNSGDDNGDSDCNDGSSGNDIAFTVNNDGWA